MTGHLDEATQEKMMAPRCGVTDRKTRGRAILKNATFYENHVFSALGDQKWPTNNLKWSLVKGTPQLSDGVVR